MTDQTVETSQRGVVIRRLLLRVSIPVAILVGVSLAAGIFLLASHEEAPASAPGTSTGTATATVTASPSATPSPTAQPSPSASPSPPPLVDEPQTGGDQPGTVVPDTYGTRPENTAGDELLTLYDTLQNEIDAYVVQTGIEVGIAVTDLQTGETISVGGNAPHKTGCVINMFALMAAVDRFQDGTASPSWVSSYSVRKGIGGSFPPEVKNFLGVIFGDFRAGEAHARTLMDEWGMETFQFDHVPYYGTVPYQPNILTALETNDILSRLWWGELFDPEWTDYTIGVLRNTFSYIDYILPKYLPWNATVGHKIGYHWDYDGWVNNDVGIVSFTGDDGQQKAYAISYFSQYAPTEWHGYSFGARLSLIVWNFMAPRYGLAPQAAPPPVHPGPPPTTPAPTVTPTDTPSPTATPSPAATTAPPITPAPTPTAAPETPTPTPTPTAPPDSPTPEPTAETMTPSPTPLAPVPPAPPSPSP